MKKRFRSISWKIWYSMAGTIVILLVLVLIASITVFSQAKNEFIFDQLEESARAKKAAEQPFVQTRGENEPLWVAHFRIDIDKDKYNVVVDQFTRALYVDKKENSLVIERIVNRVIENGDTQDKGTIKDNAVDHYYYVDWDENGRGAMVFLTTIERKSLFRLEVFALIIGLLIISFFVSRVATKKIAKPIQELEVFAEEVSKRNWKAKVPKTDPDEIGLLAEALEKMRDSLKIAEERDRQFLQSTSHDLKTPVMIIKGYAQSMLDGVGVDSKKSAAEVIKEESERLERRITQLLRLNIFGHTLEYSENREILRIDRLIRNLVSKFSIVRPQLHWDLDLREAEFKGNPEALLIAFENIIENQLRYAVSTVNISMYTDNKLDVKIANDGPPFEVNDPMELFDAYKKDKEGKFGLGLAIVKQVIQAHGGTVSAYNTKNGVEFKISF